MIDTRSTCCNAPITYQGTRLTSDLEIININTCDGCGKETEMEDNHEK